MTARFLAPPRLAIIALVGGKLAGIAIAFFWLVPGWIFFHAAGLWFVWYGMIPGAKGLGPVVTRFRTDRREVWLTLDDGPDAEDTPRILELLAKHDARATFFLIGARAAKHPELVSAILGAGHTIGHHTATHPVATFWCAGPARVARELDSGSEIFRRSGCEPLLFRAPACMKSPFLHPALATRRMRCVDWSVRSGDCVRRSAASIAAAVMRRIRPGSIILMHEGPSSSVRVEAVEAVLSSLSENGWRCVIPDTSDLA